MSVVRAKFKVTQRIDTTFTDNLKSIKVVMEPQYDKSIPEDVSFQKFTPSGRLEMVIDNPVALERLPVGKTFYVDFTPAE